mgnify:CR=1 FL=1
MWALFCRCIGQGVVFCREQPAIQDSDNIARRPSTAIAASAAPASSGCTVASRNDSCGLALPGLAPTRRLSDEMYSSNGAAAAADASHGRLF